MTEQEMTRRLETKIDDVFKELAAKIDGLKDSHSDTAVKLAEALVKVAHLEADKRELWLKYDELHHDHEALAKHLDGIGWKLAFALLGSGGLGGAMGIVFS